MTVQDVIMLCIFIFFVVIGIVGQLRERYYRRDERGYMLIGRAYKLALEELVLIIVGLVYLVEIFEVSAVISFIDNTSVRFFKHIPFMLIVLAWGLIGLNILIMERKM